MRFVPSRRGVLALRLSLCCQQTRALDHVLDRTRPESDGNYCVVIFTPRTCSWHEKVQCLAMLCLSTTSDLQRLGSCRCLFLHQHHLWPCICSTQLGNSLQPAHQPQRRRQAVPLSPVLLLKVCVAVFSTCAVSCRGNVCLV